MGEVKKRQAIGKVMSEELIKKAKGKRRVKARRAKGGAPAKDVALGDKTPAFMRWLRETDPEEFHRRYDNRLVTEI